MSLLENKTQRFHSLRVPLDNRVDYCKYTIGSNLSWIGMIKLILFVCSIVSFVLDIFSLIDGSFWYRVGYVMTFLLSCLLKLVDMAKNYDDRFTHQEPIEDFYKEVAPPNKDWEALDLDMGGGKTERVFRCAAIDQWLRGPKEIRLEENKAAEKELKDLIRNHENWPEVFAPFLRDKHREALYTGKQFYNEKKYGISAELVVDQPVQVRKTCYFDSYLTNISPGHRVLRNRDNAVLAEIPDVNRWTDWLPYEEEKGENGQCRRRLKPLDKYTMANEPGVTTLCFLDNNYIILWTQNRLAQCSTGQLVASGSGSANWEDCKKHLGKPNGLRETVIEGMNRELWEESVGKRGVDDRKFKACLTTRITGYFRWLSKAGKSEFVGISRLGLYKDKRKGDISMISYLVPEESEVLNGEKITAGNMWKLQEALAHRLDKICIRAETAHTGFGAGEHTYSVSCSMAMLALQEVCQAYCTGHCGPDCEKKCQKENCDQKPYDVLFEKQDDAEKQNT